MVGRWREGVGVLWDYVRMSLYFFCIFFVGREGVGVVRSAVVFFFVFEGGVNS